MIMSEHGFDLQWMPRIPGISHCCHISFPP